MSDEALMIRTTARFWLSDLKEHQKANLVRITAGFANNHVSWQVVVREQADEDELEEYECIFTEVLADFSTATGDGTTIKVKAPEEASFTAPLPIAIYP